LFIIYRPIASIYLPAVERNYCAYDIAMAFYNAGIFMANVVSIEKTKGINNRVYIGIERWLDTEVAYNFIMRLCNPCLETRFIHNNKHELWWAVHINKFPHKLLSPGRQNRTISNFKPSTFEEESLEKTFEEQFREEKYDWVDILLEKMESDKRFRYEQPSLEYQDFRPFYQE